MKKQNQENARRIREKTIAGLRACGWYRTGSKQTYARFQHRRSKKTYYVGLAGALRWRYPGMKTHKTLSLTDSAIHVAFQKVGELYEDRLICGEREANDAFRKAIDDMQHPED